MSNINKDTIIQQCADGYRTASGTSAPVKYGELGTLISGLAVSSLLQYTVTFEMNGEPYQVVSVNAGGSVSKPITSDSLIVVWKIGNEYLSFPYTPTADVTVTAEIMIVANYIEATGNQYINTGIIPNSNYEIQAVFYHNSFNTYNCIAGSRTDHRVNQFYVSNDNATKAIGYGSQEITKGNEYTYLMTKTKVVFSKNECIYSNGIHTSTVSANAESFTGTQPIYLFALNTGGIPVSLFNGRIYACIIKNENGDIVRNMTAAQKDGVACMYDSVSKTYFYNAGSGSFTYGSDS